MKEIHYIGSDGLPLYAISLGEGPTIIFLHGGGPDHNSFIPIAKILLPEYRTLLPDLRGYGRSVCTDKSRYTWEQYASDILSLINHIEIESAVLVAAGIGTTISLKAALRFPDRIRGMVLISIEDIEDDVEKEKEIELIETFSAAVKADGIEAAWEPILGFLSPVIGDMVRDAIPRADPESIAAAGSIVYDRAFKNYEELKEIAIPTLIIPGDDFRHPTVLAQNIAELLPKGLLSEVKLSSDIQTIADFSKTFASPIKKFLSDII